MVMWLVALMNLRNSATVTWDDPNRAQPYFHQFSAGYEREVLTGVSASVDYIRMSGHDMLFNPNLNIPMGLDTVRDGPNRVFLDPFGVLNPSLSPGEPAYNNTVRLLTTEYGYNTYDALNVSVLVDFFRTALLPTFGVILSPLLPNDIAELLVAP